MASKYANCREVAEYFGVDRSTVWRWVRNGFPKPVPTPKGQPKFFWPDIQKWEAEAREGAE